MHTRQHRIALCANTHAAPDQLFGILARAINAMDYLLDPTDIIAVIKQVLGKDSLKQFLASVDVEVSRLRVVRDWQKWHNHLRLGLSGGLLLDATAMHHFMFISRKCVGHSCFLC